MLRTSRPKDADLMGDALWRQGPRAAIEAAADALLAEITPRPPPLWVAAAPADAGESDVALYWLEKAVAQRQPQLVYLRATPSFDLLRSDPRYLDEEVLPSVEVHWAYAHLSRIGSLNPAFSHRSARAWLG